MSGDVEDKEFAGYKQERGDGGKSVKISQTLIYNPKMLRRVSYLGLAILGGAKRFLRWGGE